jgi:8-oxo-dGTP pyrophosphatase MutT (NUDIX family)
MMISQRILDEIVADTAALTGVVAGAPFDHFSKKYMEMIDVLDNDGNHLGAIPRGLAHRVGLRHAVVYAAVYDHQRRMLLQTRDGGRVDIAVGGHVQAGERDMASALAREFVEELGLTPTIDCFTLTATYNRDAPLNPKRPLERNRERRFVFSYLMPAEQIVSLQTAFASREAVAEVHTFSWYSETEVRNAIEVGKAADGLAASLPYLFSA